MIALLTITNMLSVYWAFITHHILKNEQERERLRNRRLTGPTLAHLNWLYRNNYSTTRMTGL